MARNRTKSSLALLRLLGARFAELSGLAVLSDFAESLDFAVRSDLAVL